MIILVMSNGMYKMQIQLVELQQNRGQIQIDLKEKEITRLIMVKKSNNINWVHFNDPFNVNDPTWA